MAEMPEFFDNITIGSFVLTGVPVKVYVDGVYLTITDPDDIEDPIYGFGIDKSGEVHNFDYRMIDHLLVAGQHLDLETYKKAVNPEPAAAEKPKEEPKEEEPKKEESVMKLKSLLEKTKVGKSKKLVKEDISADKKKLADLKKRKTLLAQDIATLTKKIADQEAADATAGVMENTLTDLSEPYTIQVGGMVQNINPSCMHYGSVGVVDKMIALPGDVGTVVKYTVTNDGDTFSAGDTLIKTMDQLEPYEDEMEYDDMDDSMDDWDVTMLDGLDDDDDEEEYDDIEDETEEEEDEL